MSQEATDGGLWAWARRDELTGELLPALVGFRVLALGSRDAAWSARDRLDYRGSSALAGACLGRFGSLLNDGCDRAALIGRALGFAGVKYLAPLTVASFEVDLSRLLCALLLVDPAESELFELAAFDMAVRGDRAATSMLLDRMAAVALCLGPDPVQLRRLWKLSSVATSEELELIRVLAEASSAGVRL